VLTSTQAPVVSMNAVTLSKAVNIMLGRHMGDRLSARQCVKSNLMFTHAAADSVNYKQQQQVSVMTAVRCLPDRDNQLHRIHSL